MKNVKQVRRFMPTNAAVVAVRLHQHHFLNNGFPVIVPIPFDPYEARWRRHQWEWAVNRMRTWALNHGLVRG